LKISLNFYELNSFFLSISKSEQILKYAKIGIIIFVSVYLFTNYIPYFDGSDGYTYAVASMNLAGGTYTITNELLQETGRSEFTSWAWVNNECIASSKKSNC